MKKASVLNSLSNAVRTLAMIREVGLKKMKVSMIAERADIATGTFYHFYNPPFCERHQCAMKRLGKLSLF